jgi:serine/threonine protein kinase
MMRGGDYRILEPLGKGGMGALYLAADTGAFDRKCVVKELLDYYDPTDPDEAQRAQARFETEARLLARLSHPGIPRIYSYFSEAGRHYIVMEYIEGETLEQAVTHRDLLGRTVAARPLPPEEVVRHAIRVCRVLEYLADQPTPVVHHDIKPANLIVDETSGDVRLVDFGTAQVRTRWAIQARTEQGATTHFGTEGYAAPEQYQGRSEPRADVYALAATAYHLLTDDDPGDHPFRFPQMASLPGPLADALSRALHSEVGHRCTALKFREALEAWLIPEDGYRPFVFGSGAVARTTGELVGLCDRHWPEARQHLNEGDFDHWFRERNRHDLVSTARSARQDVDSNFALETFMRTLDPRLPPPRLVVAPKVLSFGRVARMARGTAQAKDFSRQLTVRNEGRGYARVTFSASVPWLSFDPEEVGCLSGEEVTATIWLDSRTLPLWREHQAVINCIPSRGARISIPVSAELSPVREVTSRLSSVLRPLPRLCSQGARKGFSRWMRTFRSLVRSPAGVAILLAETLALAVVMVVLWWTLQDRVPYLKEIALSFLQAVPLALLAVFLLPALAYAVGAAVWQVIQSVRTGSRTRSKDDVT